MCNYIRNWCTYANMEKQNILQPEEFRVLGNGEEVQRSYFLELFHSVSEV